MWVLLRMMRNCNEQNTMFMSSLKGIVKGVNMKSSRRRVSPVLKPKNFLGSQARWCIPTISTWKAEATWSWVLSQQGKLGKTVLWNKECPWQVVQFWQWGESFRWMEVAVFSMSRTRFGFLLPIVNYLNIRKEKVMGEMRGRWRGGRRRKIRRRESRRMRWGE